MHDVSPGTQLSLTTNLLMANMRASTTNGCNEVLPLPLTVSAARLVLLADGVADAPYSRRSRFVTAYQPME
jgi:hypothetical protein